MLNLRFRSISPAAVEVVSLTAAAVMIGGLLVAVALVVDPGLLGTDVVGTYGEAVTSDGGYR